MSYIYLLRTRACVNSNEPVYKIGKTTDFSKRIAEYDEGSEPILLLYVKDCDTFEKTLINLFNLQFVKRADYGNEYFEGKVSLMISAIMEEFVMSNMCYDANYNATNATDKLLLTTENQNLSKKEMT